MQNEAMWMLKGLGLFLLLAWTGCVGHVPPKTVPVPPPPPLRLETHLIGTWELPVSGKGSKEVIFAPGGTVTFRNGLEFFNPARWELDERQHELTLLLPNASDQRLDIFHMYLGQGVKRFDRPGKRVTFDFSWHTDALNIAGWTYTKTETLAPHIESEPVFK